MWLFFTDVFVSIVADQDRPTELLIRARLPQDINKIFPDAKLFSLGDFHDYKYRAYVDRAEVARVVAQRVLDINYRNFKDTVLEGNRHDAYLGVWQAMYQIQE